MHGRRILLHAMDAARLAFHVDKEGAAHWTFLDLPQNRQQGSSSPVDHFYYFPSSCLLLYVLLLQQHTRLRLTRTHTTLVTC